MGTMADMRLIDANALVEKLKAHARNAIARGEGDPLSGLRTALFEIAYSPTVDAVPVVRCMDCKRFVENKEAVTSYCRRGLRDVYAKPDDFCSHGERRDDVRTYK